MSMERSITRVRKKQPRQHISIKPKYNNNKQNKLLFYKIWKKYNEIQLTKKNEFENENEKSYSLPC